MSKVWRKVEIMTPPEDSPVLVMLQDEEYPYIGAFDGEVWYEWHTAMPLHGVAYWMYYPFNTDAI